MSAKIVDSSGDRLAAREKVVLVPLHGYTANALDKLVSRHKLVVVQALLCTQLSRCQASVVDLCVASYPNQGQVRRVLPQAVSNLERTLEYILRHPLPWRLVSSLSISYISASVCNNSQMHA